MTAAPAIVLAVIAFALALAGGAAAWHYRRLWRASADDAAARQAELDGVRGLLQAAPAGCYAFAGLAGGASQGLRRLLQLEQTVPDFEAVCERFQPDDGARLRQAAEALQQSGTPFRLALHTPSTDRVIDAEGVPGAPAPAVWFTDATERATAEATAKTAAARLTAAFQDLPFPAWRRDPDLNLIDCNAAYARAVDQDRDTVLADGAELLGGSLRTAGQEIARRAQSEGQQTQETHHVVVSGARRLMEISEIPLPDGSLLGVARDCTREEELADELQRHVSAHAEVLENLGTAIVIYGPDMRVKFYNGAYCELWGVDEQYLDGEPHLTDVMEVLRERRRLPEQTDFPAYKRDRLKKLQNLVHGDEELMHRPDGTTLKVTLKPHPFGGVLIIYEDVTDTLSLERSFNTLIEVQRATIDNLYEAVAVFGADGRLALCNQAYLDLWNLSLDALGDRPHVRRLAEQAQPLFPFDADTWPEMMERMVARATEPEARNGRMDRPDGKVLDWAQVPLPDGQSLFTYLDVSDSIRVERALRERAEALETADRLKSEFIANISYELRTPLNAIVGFAEILENQFFGELNERQLDYAHAIVESSQRLIALINDILDLATIEAGYLELEYGEVDVATLLSELQKLAHERAHSRGIELEIDCPAETGNLVCDARRLKQALFNLLSNAFNFTPEGGRVTVTAARDADSMRLSVTDTGVGIPKDDQRRVFDKFTRAHPRTSGAGLGLSLVKSLVELHGGQVELDSAPNSGTRVTCVLPLSPDAAQSHQDRSAAAE